MIVVDAFFCGVCFLVGAVTATFVTLCVLTAIWKRSVKKQVKTMVASLTGRNK